MVRHSDRRQRKPSRAPREESTVPFPTATAALQRQLSALTHIDISSLGYSYQEVYSRLHVGDDNLPHSGRSRSPAGSTYSRRFRSVGPELSPVAEEGEDRSRSSRHYRSSTTRRYPQRTSRTIPSAMSAFSDDPFLDEVTFAYLSMRPSPHAEARKAEAMRRAKASKRRGVLKRAMGATGRALVSFCNHIPCPPLRYIA